MHSFCDTCVSEMCKKLCHTVASCILKCLPLFDIAIALTASFLPVASPAWCFTEFDYACLTQKLLLKRHLNFPACQSPILRFCIPATIQSHDSHNDIFCCWVLFQNLMLTDRFLSFCFSPDPTVECCPHHLNPVVENHTIVVVFLVCRTR